MALVPDAFGQIVAHRTLQLGGCHRRSLKSRHRLKSDFVLSFMFTHTAHPPRRVTLPVTAKILNKRKDGRDNAR